MVFMVENTRFSPLFCQNLTSIWARTHWEKVLIVLRFDSNRLAITIESQNRFCQIITSHWFPDTSNSAIFTIFGYHLTMLFLWQARISTLFKLFHKDYFSFSLQSVFLISHPPNRIIPHLWHVFFNIMTKCSHRMTELIRRPWQKKRKRFKMTDRLPWRMGQAVNNKKQEFLE